MEIIAEIGQAHDGSLGMAHSFINSLKNTGVDVVKFQTHIAAAESSEYESFRINFSYEDKTRFDYWKRMEFSLSQWKELKYHVESCGMEFMSSPFSNEAVNLLEEIGVKRYKVGSGEVNNHLLLERIARTGKNIILSSGMSNFKELDGAINFLSKRNCEVSVLQCTTSYPTKPENWGLNVISELKSRYKIKTGFSDHSGNIYAGLAAAALGAEILEVHVTYDQNMFGPDASSSLTINQIIELAAGAKDIAKSLENPVDKLDNRNFKELKSIFEKSLAINREIKKGEKIKFEDLEAKKPKGYGMSAIEYNKIIGRKLNRDLKAWDFITEEDLFEE